VRALTLLRGRGRVGMPCYRCHARQTDPVRGTSPWNRGVVAGEQVLVCPDCQRAPDWRRSLDSCARCGSTHLTKALGLVVCRDCGTRSETGRPDRRSGGTPPGDLAVDVEAALARMFGRPTIATRPPDQSADR